MISNAFADAFTGDPVSQLRQSLNATSNNRVIVDFDHTLFLSNSTEEFLACVKPGILAALLLKFLALIRPWRFLEKNRPDFVFRDTIRVYAVLCLMPWCYWTFKRQAAALFNTYENKTLSSMLTGRRSEDLVIVSYEFAFIIKAILSESPYVNTRLVAGDSEYSSVHIRRTGKATHLRQLRSSGSLQTNPDTDIVITDSPDDQDLIDTFRNTYLIQWPDEVKRPVHYNIYIPFFYQAYVKRTPEIFLKQFLLEDLPIYILGFMIFQPLQGSVLVAGILLFLAYQIVYEGGYVENDRLGFRHETAPKLGEKFSLFQTYRAEPYTWYWAIPLTLAAILLLDDTMTRQILSRIGLSPDDWLSAAITLTIIWLSMIASGRFLFALFNRAPLMWRIFVFFPLHVSRYYSPLILFTVTPAGLALLSAQVIRTWSVYAIRRCDGNFEAIASQLIRLSFYPFMLIMFALASGSVTLFTEWQTWLILLWCCVRALPEMKRKLLSAEVLDSRVPMFSKNVKESG